MRTLADLAATIQKMYGENHVVFRSKKGIAKKEVSAREYVQSSNSVAAFLQQNDLSKGERVMSVLGNSPEWHFIEMGIFLNGAIHVPLSPLMNSEQIEYVIASTEPRIILVSSSSKKKQVEAVLTKLNLNASVVNIKEQVVFSASVTAIKPIAIEEDDIAVILYTSGSTDKPKGVALTHKNITIAISEFSSLDIFENCTDAISFLPLSHSGERKLNYSYLMRGIAICFPARIDSMPESLNFFKPQITALVPYLLQQLVIEVPLSFNFNNLKVVCGGAPLHKNLNTAFTQKGGRIFEVYGLTETSSLLAYNTESAEMPGTVGRLAKNISVQFSEQGEIWVKGEGVMKGYWVSKNEIDASRNADGWFQTGDLGHLNEEGFLNITGRNSNCFKNSKGVFIVPEQIENQLSEFFHSQFVVVFANETGYLSAIVKRENSAPNGTEKNIFTHYNRSKKDDLKINRYLVVNDSMNDEEMISNLKLNRKKIIANYKDQPFEQIF